MLSAKYVFLLIGKCRAVLLKKQSRSVFVQDNRIIDCSQSVHSIVRATLHSSKPGGIAVRTQFLPKKRENAKCFPEFPEKLD